MIVKLIDVFISGFIFIFLPQTPVVLHHHRLRGRPLNLGSPGQVAGTAEFISRACQFLRRLSPTAIAPPEIICQYAAFSC
jgi:hypothetical protein